MTKTRATFALGFLFLSACSRSGSLSTNDTATPASEPTASASAALTDRPTVPPPPPPAADGVPTPSAFRDSDAKPGAPRRGASPNAGMQSGTGGAFNRAAAAHALDSVDLSGCGGTPGSSGHVTVTFSPDGSAKSEIDTGSERASEACIRSRYDAVRIPSFDSPGPVKTGKEFHIPGL